MQKLSSLDSSYYNPLTWERYKEGSLIESKLQKFTGLLSYYLCTCQGTMRFQKGSFRYDVDRKYTHNKIIHSPHHSGQLNEIMQSGEKATREQIDDWVMDTEHGLFHSFIVAFLAFLKKYPDGIPDLAFESAAHLDSEDVRLMASCLFHDFYRVVENDNKDHDSKLAKYFPDLDDITYSHSDPQNDDHPLIMADRLELMRYSDYKSWSDLSIIEKYWEPQLRHLYFFTRPALEKLFEGRRDIWIMHGVEKEKKWYAASESYPAAGTYMKPVLTKPSYDCQSPYPIEIGDLPIRSCLMHSGRSFQPWGFISLKDFKERGGEICLTHCTKGWEDTIYQPHQVFKDGKKRCWTKQGEMIGKRDHMYAVSDIPLSEWTFILYVKPPKVTAPLLYGKGSIDFTLANQIIETTNKLINHLIILKT